MTVCSFKPTQHFPPINIIHGLLVFMAEKYMNYINVHMAKNSYHKYVKIRNKFNKFCAKLKIYWRNGIKYKEKLT